jgi:hypothetical protein
MTEIEHRLRAAMHAAVDGEEAPHDLVSLVMRRHRRHAALVAGLATLVVVAAGAGPTALALRGGGPPSVARPTSPTSPTISSSSPAHPATPKPGHRTPSRLRGLPMPPGTSLQLLLTGPSPALFSLTTRTAEPIAGLPATRAGYGFTRVVGGWSVYPATTGPQCTPDCAGPPLPEYFLADGSLTATRIGLGFRVGASDRGGAVWLVTFRRSTDDIDTVHSSAQLVSTAGTPIGPRYQIPAGYLLERAVGGYLLLAATSQPGTPTYQLWDPRTGRTVRGFDNAIAADREQVAWIDACDNCPVHLLNTSTGKALTIGVPQRSWAYNGTFSSDGRLLAVQLSAGVTADGQATEARIGVIDVATRRMIVIQGSTVSLNKSLYFGWQPGSHRLIVAWPQAGRSIQVAYWQPGDTRLRVTTTALPRGMSPVLGESG